MADRKFTANRRDRRSGRDGLGREDLLRHSMGSAPVSHYILETLAAGDMGHERLLWEVGRQFPPERAVRFYQRGSSCLLPLSHQVLMGKRRLVQAALSQLQYHGKIVRIKLSDGVRGWSLARERQ